MTGQEPKTSSREDANRGKKKNKKKSRKGEEKKFDTSMSTISANGIRSGFCVAAFLRWTAT